MNQRRTTSKTADRNKFSSLKMHLELSDVLEAFPFYVMLVDERHYILQANRAVWTELGMDPRDIVGKYCPAVMHGMDKPIDNCPLEEAVAKNQAVEREILDALSGHWVRSAVYPTGGHTADGHRIFFHMVTDISDRKKAEEQLRTANEQLRNLSRHLESIREEERTHLAREMHDKLGQILTGLKMDMSWMAKRLPEGEMPLLEKIKTINGLIDEAVQTVKRIATELRPGVLDHLGLAAAIEWQTQELEKHAEIKFEFKSSHNDVALDRGRSTAIFRICQEALTNIVRHAGATRVTVTLKEGPDRVILKVRDNGKGIGKEQLSDPKAFGIIGMKERARSWGGEVEISSLPGKGTTVTVSIPLAKKDGLDVENSDR